MTQLHHLFILQITHTVVTFFTNIGTTKPEVVCFCILENAKVKMHTFSAINICRNAAFSQME